MIYNDVDRSTWRTVLVWFTNWLMRNLDEDRAKKWLARVDPNVVRGEKPLDPPAVIESLARIFEEEKEEGLRKGREEGILKGQLIGRIQLGEKVLGKPVTAGLELQQLETEQLQRLTEKLEKEIEARNSG